jgi:hypothetical protein
MVFYEEILSIVAYYSYRYFHIVTGERYDIFAGHAKSNSATPSFRFHYSATSRRIRPG